MINVTSFNNNKKKNELIQSLEEFYSQSQFNKLKLDKIVESAIHWSLVNGIQISLKNTIKPFYVILYHFNQKIGFVIVPKDCKETDLMVCTFLPFTLLPTPLKREFYEQLTNLQPKINSLIFKIANSPNVLRNAFSK